MPLVLAEPRQLGREAQAGDLGVGFGSRVAAEGYLDTSEVGARIFDAEMRARAAAAATRAAQRLETSAADELAREGEIGPNGEVIPGWATAEQRFEERRQQILAEGADEAGLAGGYRELYDQKASEYGHELGMRVRQEARRRAFGDAQSHAHQTLANMADLEASTKDPGTRARLRADADAFLSEMFRSGVFDAEEREKARSAFNEASWKAAVEKGLYSDPAALAAELREGGSGPFAHDRMREEDRQNAIGQAEAAIKSQAAQARAAERFGIAKAKEERRQAAAEAHGRAVSAAMTGELTPELYAELEPAMTPTQRAWAAGIVAKGGKFLPGPPDPGYYAEVMDERARNPAAFARRTIDPNLAGNQAEELIRAQSAINEGRPLAIESTLAATAARWLQMNAPTGWFDDVSDLPDLGSPESDRLEGEFYLRVKERAEMFHGEQKRPPNATEFEKEILDPVVLGFVRDFGAGASAVTGRGQMLPFIPNDRRRQVEESLRARGLPVTPANIEALYQRLLEEEAFE